MEFDRVACSELRVVRPRRRPGRLAHRWRPIIALAATGPVITAPPDAPLTIEGHRIRFADGRRLILHLDPDKPETTLA